MNRFDKNPEPDSPFHRGEREIQSRLGVRERMESFGRRVIRSYLPEQHRDFYRQLPYLLLGSMDSEGQPWASILCGEPGFVNSSDKHSVTISAEPLAGDPLRSNLTIGSFVGVLGIELATRRRNRMSTVVRIASPSHFKLEVVQSFGNCPQYIQAREFETYKENLAGPVTVTEKLTTAMRMMIQTSDTFFVASASASAAGQSASEGGDVSHRGGRPGFVKVDDSGELWIPDYPGNNHFNTLGNFLEYPKAGLLFPDFTTGDLLSLSGSVAIDWDHPETGYFEGAKRFWRFRPERCVLMEDALPIRAIGVEPSLNNSITGTWDEAARKRQVETLKDQWVPACVVKTADEGGDVRSFYLSPELPARPGFIAGQFLPVRAMVEGSLVQRTYTLSSGPADDLYRISVKRDGRFSTFAHDALIAGEQLEVKAPAGAFILDEGNTPLLLIGAGIGITPMVSMARHLLSELLRWRSMRKVTLLVIVRSKRHKIFVEELSRLEQESNGHLHVYWCLTRPDDNIPVARDSHFLGRPNLSVLRQLLPAGDEEVYLCGPAPFMQDSYALLRELGVPDRRIFAEAFGPGALQRENDTVVEEDVAESALVTFVDEHGDVLLEQGWRRTDGSLLAFAEAHGINPDFSCRSGQCGSCLATRVDGELLHNKGTIEVGSNDVLLCSARPRATDERQDSAVCIKVGIAQLSR